MSEEVKRVGRDLAYEGTVIKVYKDHMKFANGNTADWDFIHHDGAAAVVPVMDDGKILMVTQYRNALERDTLEIPAGKLDAPGEPGIECASRELEEETGYRSEDLEWLITLRTTVAFCDEKMYNGVLIGNTANAAKILTEEYMTTVTPDAEKDQLLWFTYEGMTEKNLKKKMNMMEAFVSSI